MIKKSKMFYFVFIFLFTASSIVARVSLPLRLIGFDKVINDVTAAKNSLKDSISSVEFLFLMIQVFLFIIVFFLAVASIFGIYRELKIYRLKKLRMILGELRLEIILKNSGMISNVKEELFELIENIVQKKYFLKIVGERCRHRIIHSLYILKFGKVDFEKQVELVSSLLRVIECF